jgi:hypothetical protein
LKIPVSPVTPGFWEIVMSYRLLLLLIAMPALAHHGTNISYDEKKIFRLQPKEEIREEICVPTIEAEFNRRTRDPAAGLTNK